MAGSKKKLAEFKDFVLQGDVVDLAVAVIIALYFGPIIKDVVNLILTILAIPGSSHRSFAELSFTIGHGTFFYGVLIQDIITFLLVAAVVFFIVIRPLRNIVDKRRRVPDPDSETRPCPECLSDIPKAASRCAHCTVEVGPAA